MPDFTAPPIVQQPLTKIGVDPKMLTLAPPIYIYNVGPDVHQVQLGGLGKFIIPACPQGRSVSEPLIVSGLHPEQQTIGEVNVNNYLHGSAIVADILGLDSQQADLSLHTTNRTWMGCFAAAGATPTKAEIAEANAKLQQFRVFAVEDADRRALNGPGDNGLGGINSIHRAALRALKLKRSWAEHAIAQEECPACSSPIKAGIAKCPHCHAILDREKAALYGLIPVAAPAFASVAPAAEQTATETSETTTPSRKRS